MYATLCRINKLGEVSLGTEKKPSCSPESAVVVVAGDASSARAVSIGLGGFSEVCCKVLPAAYPPYIITKRLVQYIQYIARKSK